MSLGRGLLVAIAVLLAGVPAWAQPGTPEEMPISLPEAVRLGLERSLDLKIERYEPRIAREDTRRAAGDFDPTLQLSAVWDRTETPVNSALQQQASGGLIVEQGLRPEASVLGKLITGTQYNVALTTPVLQTTDPNRLYDHYYRPVLTFALVQPLLKDFGPEVNLVRFRQAERRESIAALAVEARMLSVIREVEAAYWQLLLMQEHVRVAQGSLDLARDLAERLGRLLAIGRATALDLRQAEATAAMRQADLQRARAERDKAQLQLQLLINPEPAARARLVAMTRPPEEGVPVDLDGKVARGLARRPELRRQELVIETLRLEELAARNGTLPRLDVVGSLGWTGMAGTGVGPNIRTTIPPRLAGDTYTDAFQDFLTPSGNVSWYLGLRLQMPFGNNDAAGRLEQARLRGDQERVRLTLMKNQVSADVQAAFQDMDAGWALVVASEEQIRVQREQLDAVERQFAAGLATVRTVLEAQDALGRAEGAWLQALVGYGNANARLAAASTASFDTYRLVIPR